MNDKIDLLTLYRNYLFALEERRLYGDRYGDTDQIINYYEECLGKRLVKKKDDNKNK